MTQVPAPSRRLSGRLGQRRELLERVADRQRLLENLSTDAAGVEIDSGVESAHHV